MRGYFAAVFISLASVTQAYAWGTEGHSIIAEIAQRRLAPQARDMVTGLLGGASLASVSSWADDIREQRPNTYNWDFVDIPLMANDYRPDRDCRPDPVHGDCIVAEIERAKKDLHCAADKAGRLEALKFLVQFVGDLHQPFNTVSEEKGMNEHAVTLRMGGETCSAKCAFARLRPADANLHDVWDTILIQKEVHDWGAYVDRLETEWLPIADVARIDQGDPAAWATETHLVAQDVFKDTPADDYLSDSYLAKMLPILDQQLATAGLRLARTLNDPVSCN